MITGMHHVAVMTAKYDESLDFYHDLLGLPLVHSWISGPRRLALLGHADSAMVELVECAPDAAEPQAHADHPIAHFTFRVDDVDAAIEPVRDAGWPITVETKDAMLGDRSARLAFFTGPNGETVEFFASDVV